MFLLFREQEFCNFCCNPCKITFCIEEVSVGEIYNTLLDSNEGDLSPQTSQTVYFSKTNENKKLDKDHPPQPPNPPPPPPPLVDNINNIGRHLVGQQFHAFPIIHFMLIHLWLQITITCHLNPWQLNGLLNSFFQAKIMKAALLTSTSSVKCVSMMSMTHCHHDCTLL